MLNKSVLLNTSLKSGLSPLQLIMSQPAWGSKQALTQLGLKLNKPSTGTTDVIVLVCLSLVENTEVACSIVDEIGGCIRGQLNVFPKERITEVMKQLWAQYKDVPNVEEKSKIKQLLIKTQEGLPDIVGRNIALNSLHCATIEAFAV